MATAEVAVNMSGTASTEVEPETTPELAPETETPKEPSIKEILTAPEKSEEEAEPPKVDEFDLSKKFAALSRREKQILLKEKELKEKWGELEEFQKLKTSPKENIPSILQKLGLTYSEITDAVLNDGKPTVEMKLRALEEKIEQDKIQREKNEAEKKKAEEDAHHQRVIDSHKRQVREFIDSKPDDFELIKANDAHEEVFNVIEQYWRKTGQILPMDKAAAHVEEEFLNETKKLMGLKKVKGFFEPKAEEAPKDVATPMPRVVPRMVESSSPRTLSNQMAAQAVPSARPSSYLSEDESKKKVAEYLKKMMTT